LPPSADIATYARPEIEAMTSNSATRNAQRATRNRLHRTSSTSHAAADPDRAGDSQSFRRLWLSRARPPSKRHRSWTRHRARPFVHSQRLVAHRQRAPGQSWGG